MIISLEISQSSKRGGSYSLFTGLLLHDCRARSLSNFYCSCYSSNTTIWLTIAHALTSVAMCGPQGTKWPWMIKHVNRTLTQTLTGDFQKWSTKLLWVLEITNGNFSLDNKKPKQDLCGRYRPRQEDKLKHDHRWGIVRSLSTHDKPV